jgi:hypothetical protein
MLDHPANYQEMLAKARAALKAVDDQMIELDEKKLNAAMSQEAFEAWSVDRAALIKERERFPIQIEALGAALARAVEVDDGDAIKRRHADKLVENA